MVSLRTIFSFVPILFLLSKLSSAARATYNVVDYGAKNGGVADSSKAFLHAWAAACASKTPATVYVPRGVFLLAKRTIFLGQNCKNSIVLKINGALVAPWDYNVLGNKGNWIAFEGVNRLNISGGLLDGRGGGLWKCKAAGKPCPVGATTLAFYHSNNVVVSNLKLVKSQFFHVGVQNCRNVILQGMNIFAPSDSPNTDGIHVENSFNVNVLSSNIGTGDDCISIGPGATGVWIENVFCGPGHGISIGSLGQHFGEDGVQNVTVRHCTLKGTTNGVRIKTWAKPSKGFVKNVVYHNVTMVDAENPIIIDQNYCPQQQGCPKQSSGVKISGVTYQEIHGTSRSKVAISINCSNTTPCSGITLQDINLSYGRIQAQASCSNVNGKSIGVVQPKGCFHQII